MQLLDRLPGHCYIVFNGLVSNSTIMYCNWIHVCDVKSVVVVKWDSDSV